MRKFEAKLTSLEREILAVKDENTVLKSKQANQTKEIETLREERDYYKRDYKALKQTNKNLEKELNRCREELALIQQEMYFYILIAV